MLLSTQRVFILVICIGLLVVQPVSGLRSIGLAIRWSKEDDRQVVTNQRLLKEVVKEEVNVEKKAATLNKKLDPYQSSKRRVRRGADPIHNRS